MPQNTFKAWVADQKDGGMQVELKELEREALPEGEVLVEVAYSTLNYKDGLAMTGQGRIIRKFPLVPGIDFSGSVVESASPDYQPGDKVVLTGWGVGESHWGGFAQMARVKAGWLVPLPPELSLKQAMGIGTAGVTAMLCIMALEEKGLISTDPREVVVTGAAGGVGSIAVAILANLGYNVVASTGRAELHDYLRWLGAKEILDRSVLAKPGKPLESERWAGAVDTVGGDTLAALLPGMVQESSIAACGNAGGFTLNTTVFPFILRGVSILGINSVLVPKPRRLEAWARLAHDLPLEALGAMIHEAPLAALPDLSQQILKGQIKGRVVIDVNA
ncbi:MAG: oxidoreductase [Anaerolineales bacterium]|nr:oxidoreductase [Anaerolineales bacterium]